MFLSTFSGECACLSVSFRVCLRGRLGECVRRFSLLVRIMRLKGIVTISEDPKFSGPLVRPATRHHTARTPGLPTQLTCSGSMFPTHVGMNPRRNNMSLHPFYAPHARGDEPRRLDAPTKLLVPSPEEEWEEPGPGVCVGWWTRDV